jgi:hypothetical protein
MEHKGGCHCGNIRFVLRLTKPPSENATRSCACAFCRAHATRTVSDPSGHVDIHARDWTGVERYRFASRTAAFLLCKTCGIYIGAVCETTDGPKAVTNVNSLNERALFPPASAHPDHDNESVEARMTRRAANWTPATLHGSPSADF